MRITNIREERAQQKVFLSKLYPDYIATRHDAFVIRYNKDLDDKAIKEYMVNRGISTNAENKD